MLKVAAAVSYRVRRRGRARPRQSRSAGGSRLTCGEVERLPVARASCSMSRGIGPRLDRARRRQTDESRRSRCKDLLALYDEANARAAANVGLRFGTEPEQRTPPARFALASLVGPARGVGAVGGNTRSGSN